MFALVSLSDAHDMGIGITSTGLTFNITNETLQAAGQGFLQAEILLASIQNSTIPNIYQYHFNPQSDVAVIQGLRCESVYNVRFFVIKKPVRTPIRRYFVNTFIKTGTFCGY